MGVVNRLLSAADPEHKKIHGLMKSTIVGGLGLAANCAREMYEIKVKNGFVQQPARIFNEAFDELIKIDEGIRAPGYDYIRNAYRDLQTIFVVMMDEDTHFLMRGLLWHEIMFKKRDAMAEALIANEKFFKWQDVYSQVMKEQAKGVATGSQRQQWNKSEPEVG